MKNDKIGHIPNITSPLKQLNIPTQKAPKPYKITLV